MTDPRLAPFRGPALAFALFLALSAVSAAVLFALKLGTAPAQVQAYYLGSEAAFTEPRTLQQLLLVAVPHLLAMPLALFAVAHVVGFARVVGERAQAALVRLSFGSAGLGILAGFGVRSDLARPGLGQAGGLPGAGGLAAHVGGAAGGPLLARPAVASRGRTPRSCPAASLPPQPRRVGRRRSRGT
ncbi:MAG: hypothetical protein QM767_13680 [Anaeromyxobacter sp.]